MGTPRDLPLFVEKASFHHAAGIAERNRVGEVEIASGLDQGEVHAGGAGVRNDLLDLCDGEVATCGGDLPWLVVDDPVANAGLHPTEILAGKLVSLSGAVVVDRI